MSVVVFVGVVIVLGYLVCLETWNGSGVCSFGNLELSK